LHLLENFSLFLFKAGPDLALFLLTSFGNNLEIDLQAGALVITQTWKKDIQPGHRERKREREREKDIEREREREREREMMMMCVCECVSVCVCVYVLRQRVLSCVCICVHAWVQTRSVCARTHIRAQEHK